MRLDSQFLALGGSQLAMKELYNLINGLSCFVVYCFCLSASSCHKSNQGQLVITPPFPQRTLTIIELYHQQHHHHHQGIL